MFSFASFIGTKESEHFPVKHSFFTFKAATKQRSPKTCKKLNFTPK